MRFGLAVALVLLAALPAIGQEPQGIAWTSPFSIGGGVENRLPVGNRTVTDNIITLDSPALSYIRRSPRNVFTGSYIGEFEMFAHHSDLNSSSHAGGFRDSYELTRRATFDFGDVFLFTQDPARWLSGAFFLLPRTDFKENDAYVGVGYLLSRLTSLNVRFDATYASASDTQSVGLNLFDNRTYAQSASLSRVLTKNNKISGTYAFVRVDPLGPPPTPGISIIRNMHTVSLAYTYTHGGDFLFSVGGGALRSNTTNYSLDAHIERKLQSLRFRADYGRQFAAFTIIGSNADPTALIPGFANALLPSAVVDTGAVEIAGRLGPRIGFDMRGTYARNSSALTSQNIRTWVAGARLDYRLVEHVYAFVAVNLFRQNLTLPLGVPIDRNRYEGGLEFALSRSRLISEESTALPNTDRLGNSLLRDDTLLPGPVFRRKD